MNNNLSNNQYNLKIVFRPFIRSDNLFDSDDSDSDELLTSDQNDYECELLIDDKTVIYVSKCFIKFYYNKANRYYNTTYTIRLYEFLTLMIKNEKLIERTCLKYKAIFNNLIEAKMEFRNHEITR